VTVTALLISLGVLTLAGAGVAAYYRSEARRYHERADRYSALVVSVERSLDLEAEGRAEDKRRLEAVAGDWKKAWEEKCADYDALLADHPELAGERLRRVLSNVPSGDVSDHPVVQPVTAAAPVKRARKPRA
jgi:hypothetical protein